MFKHILVPIDGSELSEDAVARAVSFAKARGWSPRKHALWPSSFW